MSLEEGVRLVLERREAGERMGVADGRRTGVRHQRTGLPRQQPLQNLRTGGSPIVLVIAHQLLSQPQMVQQLHRHPRVLGGSMSTQMNMDEAQMKDMLSGLGDIAAVSPLYFPGIRRFSLPQGW